MNVNLQKYASKRICVAVSGGKDSMALLHYMYEHCAEYAIELSALNCDHGMREETSERDSEFVAAYCGGKGIPLYGFAAQKGVFKDENSARTWRLECYRSVLHSGKADCIATAHHTKDNAETVLFNLARGASLSGVCGIADSPSLGIIRPLIACSREEIDEYIEVNQIPFVTDETNLTLDYTRNKIRMNVLPALEEAVPGAVNAIYRFSCLAQEDERYFARKTEEFIVRRNVGNYLVKTCSERVIFRRAAQKIVADYFQRRDYTSAHFEKLFELQSATNGKKFEFLGLVAVKEKDGVAITDGEIVGIEDDGMPFTDSLYDGQMLRYCGEIACLEYADDLEDALEAVKKICSAPLKVLHFDISKIPETAVVRFRRKGDKFTKFGGGTVSLSDYLTDKKIPQSLRDRLPLVCNESDVLLIGGVEISDSVKVAHESSNEGVFICKSPE